ncbi:MAG TPA: SCO family protein [Burkholderiales bacterium]
MARSTRVLLACLMTLAAACTPSAPTFKGADVTGAEWGGDLTLTAHTGVRASTADFRGRVLVVFFGYVNCPDICGPTLAKLAGLRDALGPVADRLQVVFVTVDPARDGPAELAQFLSRFDASFVGLTGSAEEIVAAAREYRVVMSPAPAPHGHADHAAAASRPLVPIDHTGTMFVKDPAGKLRLLWKSDTTVADMLHDVRLLLGQAA